MNLSYIFYNSPWRSPNRTRHPREWCTLSLLISSRKNRTTDGVGVGGRRGCLLLPIAAKQITAEFSISKQSASITHFLCPGIWEWFSWVVLLIPGQCPGQVSVKQWAGITCCRLTWKLNRDGVCFPAHSLVVGRPQCLRAGHVMQIKKRRRRKDRKEGRKSNRI